MTFNPSAPSWNGGTKTLIGLLTICAFIGGSAKYLGGMVYDISAAQTRMLDRMETTDSNYKIIMSRVSTIESNANTAAISAAKVEQKLDGFEKILDEVKSIGQKNLDVSNSHSEAITATRNAVAPRRSVP